MYICRVKGKCVSTIKNKDMTGYSLVTVQKLTLSGKTSGELLVAVDTLGCSVGETVLVTAGSSARAALREMNSPADLAIIGIVDSCDFND